MTAHVERERVMVIDRTGAQRNTAPWAYRATCFDHAGEAWRAEPHIVGRESAPHFAALCDCLDHNEEAHPTEVDV